MLKKKRDNGQQVLADLKDKRQKCADSLANMEAKAEQEVHLADRDRHTTDS